MSNVGRSFLNHPIRIITPTLISGTCSYAASNLPTVFSSTAQATIPQLETLIDTGTISSTATISVTAAGISASESLSITGALSLTATETSGVLSVQAATITSSTLAVPPIVSTPTPQINKNRFFSPTPSTSAESSRLEQSPRHNI